MKQILKDKILLLIPTLINCSVVWSFCRISVTSYISTSHHLSVSLSCFHTFNKLSMQVLPLVITNFRSEPWASHCPPTQRLLMHLCVDIDRVFISYRQLTDPSSCAFLSIIKWICLFSSSCLHVLPLPLVFAESFDSSNHLRANHLKKL